ncbi:MAG: hypothetical protein CL489_10405 [Acidobacteria bacterium]|nr:hypothetical protein [Acidobacteriota bacterium]|tara:strand:+ start:18730 stop:19185 length:456 start_codon:yes stop_codon:yes gene_type:complete
MIIVTAVDPSYLGIEDLETLDKAFLRHQRLTFSRLDYLPQIERSIEELTYYELEDGKPVERKLTKLNVKEEPPRELPKDVDKYKKGPRYAYWTTDKPLDEVLEVVFKVFSQVIVEDGISLNINDWVDPDYIDIEYDPMNTYLVKIYNGYNE